MNNNSSRSIRTITQVLVLLLLGLIVVACNTASKPPHAEHDNHVAHTDNEAHNEHANHSGHGDPMSHGDGSAAMDHMAHMAMTKHDPLKYTSREHAVTQVSERGKYRVTLYSNASPIPLQQFHEWTVHVEDMAGKPYEGRVFINGGMPMHRHGFPTKPRSKTYLGNGDYQVEGIKFNMHGEWEMRFNISMQGGHSDRVVFKVDLRPEKVAASSEWNATELGILGSMTIDNMKSLPDPSNRVADNTDAAALGQKLFFDKRFSANGQVACASCHKPELYFTDGLKTSQGIGTVKRNAPTIVGASFHTWFFHDGRADSLWSQALGPMEDRQEHGGSRTQYAHIIYNDPTYRKSYEKLFGKMPDLSDSKRFPAHAGPVKDKQLLTAWKAMSEKDRKAITLVYVNLGKAIAAYERQLKPAASRFDNYVKAALENNQEQMGKIMTVEEVAGLKLFLGKANCTICHNGPLFTDLGFHNIATPPVNVKRYDYGRKKGVTFVKRNPFNCRGEYNDNKDKQCDELKYMGIHEEDTMAAFKTPSLRNVSKTAPYMHAGQYETLSDVMKHYAKPPSTKVGLSDLLPVELGEKELEQLEAFLLTLDSPIDADPAILLPPS